VYAIVAAAPEIPGWTILSLKPKLGFPVTARWEDLTITVANVVFNPLDIKGSDDFGLLIYVPGIRHSDTEKAHNALLRAIDHGLGERRFAQAVQYTEVHPLPDDASADDFIPLAHLEKYIEWREGKRKDKIGQQMDSSDENASGFRG
jgi:hypothetical protein